MIRVALAGNPNCGKTTLFNSLTGSTARVGNWPGVTVDKKDGMYKKCPEPVAIIDLPGIYSLSPYTSEEVIARNYIIEEKPDCIINVVDASNLERNLYLTTQILEMDVPVVVALNFMDVVEKNGERIDINKLSKKLGVPVVPVSALREENLEKLMDKAYQTTKSERTGTSVLNKSPIVHLIKDCQIAFEALGVKHPLFHAVKLVELDDLEIKDHQELVKTVESYKEHNKDEMNELFGDDYAAMIADARYNFITKEFGKVKTTVVEMSEEELEERKKKGTVSDKIDKIITNKWLGIPLFLLIMLLIFHFTFSENLFWLGGLIQSDFLGDAAEDSFASFFTGAIWHEGGINSLGVMLQSFVVGLTDWISSVVASWLSGAQPWVSGLVCDGILGGVFSVLSFLPQILLLFLFFSILEDTGYMSRVAFILDRALRKFGLSGRAVMPMIMGFGCSVPAMINTRTLASEEEKMATIRVIPFFSCGAKLPILTAIAGGIITYFGVGNSDIITYSMYLIGIVTAITCVILMRNTTMRGKETPFIMELPAYHMPQFKSTMAHLWDKMKHFIQKAFTIIMASTIIIWVLTHLGWNPDASSFGFLEDEMMNTSLLGYAGRGLQWLFTPVGFGSQLNDNGWAFVLSSITGLIAKENVIATFGTLGTCLNASFIADEGLEGVDSAVQMIQATGIGIPGLLSFIAFNMTTIPCFSAVATARGELPRKKFWTTIGFWLATSYIVGAMIYTIGEFVWPVAIWAIALIALFVGIYVWNKKHPIKSK